MKVHHVNCATMCPPFSRRLVNRQARLVAHCLIIESAEGLVLVDTGFGTRDLADGGRRLGRAYRALTGPRLDPAETMLAHLSRLGLRPDEVRHIVPTHLDVDHAGGISDFPSAQVHIYRPEQEAATTRPTLHERTRYRPYQLEGARWVLHEPDGQGDTWNGLTAMRPLGTLDLALVPLVGHTRGHCGVAVRSDGGWLLHAGDAYFHAGQVVPERERCPFGLRAFQQVVAHDNAARVANLERLREIARQHRGDLTVFCAHDPSELEAVADRELQRSGNTREPRPPGG